MGGREKGERESSGGLGIARASVRARDRTCVAQRNRLGDGDDARGGLWLIGGRAASVFSPRFHEARPPALKEAGAVDAAALAGASHARRCCHAAAALFGAPSVHLHLWGRYTSVAESFLMACAPSVTLLGQRRVVLACIAAACCSTAGSTLFSTGLCVGYHRTVQLRLRRTAAAPCVAWHRAEMRSSLIRVRVR